MEDTDGIFIYRYTQIITQFQVVLSAVKEKNRLLACEVEKLDEVS